MQTNFLILVGLIMVVVLTGKSQANKNRPQWAEHLRGWQVIFAVAAFVAALLVMLNPELLALGLLGDSAFFDLLILAFGLQFRNVVFLAWGSVHHVLMRVRSAMARSWQRDYVMVVVSLAPIGTAALAACKVVAKHLRQHDHLFT
jgi:hypothetical protein